MAVTCWIQQCTVRYAAQETVIIVESLEILTSQSQAEPEPEPEPKPKPKPEPEPEPEPKPEPEPEPRHKKSQTGAIEKARERWSCRETLKFLILDGFGPAVLQKKGPKFLRVRISCRAVSSKPNALYMHFTICLSGGRSPPLPLGSKMHVHC